MSIVGSPKTATVDIDRDSEFTGDDVDQFSSLVDLGREYDKLIITLPTLTSSAVNIYVQNNALAATVPTALHHGWATGDAATWLTAAWQITAGTGGLTIVCGCLGGARYIRIRCTSNQGSDRAITVRGASS
tara:strand:- start:153 stop:545 length:393 start_codon:yes stop_codon:yes gene_type:complete